jgi:hypothetical protein
MHYAPLNDGLRTCWAERWGQDWGVTVRLPANPGEQSRRKYDFDRGPDALNYCHDVLCHLVDVAETTEGLPEVRSYLDSPAQRS